MNFNYLNIKNIYNKFVKKIRGGDTNIQNNNEQISQPPIQEEALVNEPDVQSQESSQNNGETDAQPEFNNETQNVEGTNNETDSVLTPASQFDPPESSELSKDLVSNQEPDVESGLESEGQSGSQSE
jgi:hypothetical protein